MNTVQSLTLRPERRADRRAVEELIWYAHEDPVRDGPLYAHKLRRRRNFVPELDFVAELDGRIVGSIMYQEAFLALGRRKHKILTMGPLSVHPEFQNRGVGRALLERTIALARQTHYRAIIFYGNPDYYPRLGFVPAYQYNINSEEHLDALHAMPLYDGALDGFAGARFHERTSLPKRGVVRFNRKLAPKNAPPMTPISVLLEQLEPEARDVLAKRKDIGRPLEYLSQMRRQSERELAELMDQQAIDMIRAVMKEYGIGWGMPKTKTKEEPQ